ncbi:DUF4407 domain-containing protein [Longispora sp. NPDC051575]|uniref:DUF4407 domain-containing protein n=1 Tax=Longispora sp. NPDC051575 TaxID=3154943 RepID=UPI00342224C5
MTETLFRDPDTIRLPHVSPEPTPDGMLAGTYRPTFSDRGVGQLFRRIVGIREDVLDWVPEHRPGYTRLGAIVLNTGVMAALSLFMALNKVVDTWWILLIPPALLWGFLILCLDSWMVASTHGFLSATAKIRVLIPRLVISVLIGAAIAEPMLLWVFQPSITKEVQDTRKHELDVYESQLKLCNPVTGEVPAADQCADLHLTIKDTPNAKSAELAATQDQRDKLRTEVDRLNKEWGEKEKLAQAECAGTAGPLTTGLAGDGPECQRNREIADRFLRDSQLGKHQSDLAALNEKLRTLEAEKSTIGQRYSAEVGTQITAKVQAKRDDQGMIGLLDEGAALGRLADESAFVHVAEWMVRLLLVAIDAMPVLAKLMSGVSKYDRLVSRQVDTGQRLHDTYLTMREHRDSGTWQDEIRRMEQDQRGKVAQIEEDDRTASSRREQEIDAEIDALAARLRGGQHAGP